MIRIKYSEHGNETSSIMRRKYAEHANETSSIIRI